MCAWHDSLEVAVRAVVQAVIRLPVTAETQIRSQVSPRGIFGAQSGTGTGFSPSTYVFPCQYHSTNAPYSFIPLPPTLYGLRNWQCPAIRYLKTAIDGTYFHTQQSPPGLSNGSELCSLWGKTWTFLNRINALVGNLVFNWWIYYRYQ